MTYEMTLNSANFVELSNDEMFAVDGGWDAGAFFTGLGILGGGVIAIASAPVTVPLAAMVFGGALLWASSGYFIGDGLEVW